jgi:RNA polymerase sigma factor (sigma-70 family)
VTTVAVVLTREQQDLVRSATVPLTKMAMSFVRRYPERHREDLVQVALETAARAVVAYDPTRGASFTSFAWCRAMFEIVKEAARLWKSDKRTIFMAMVSAASEIALFMSEPDDAFFHASDAEQQAQFAEAGDAACGAMTLSLLGKSTPEAEAILAEDRRRVEAALAEILPKLEAGERSAITRRYVNGESLQDVLGTTGAAYNREAKKFYRAVARIGSEFRNRGIGPSTARTLGDMKLDE